ncbi:uncharacterized protein IWZ02DRAFT_411377 [Phyllosticta citriasiana]|uniref:NADH dehydrogenase [ubiquinone] 1 alpha subcomplex assembly factor 3 n=1 Tax=Phyllosticta citriasiana TaxID=595635 RepID=A0ABR1KIE6_9PEZI
MPPQPPPLRPSALLRPIYRHLSPCSSSHAMRVSPILPSHPYSTKRTPSPTLRTTRSTRPPSNSETSGGSSSSSSIKKGTADRGPASKEPTQTDFGALDVLASMPPPTTAIDATLPDGFSLNSGIEVAGAGVLLYGGEAFRWRPWVREQEEDDEHDGIHDSKKESGGSGSGNGGRGSLRDVSGLLWECGRRAWGVLDVAWPKPDLLIIGTGATIVPISPTTRRHINDLGIRLEVADTRNAASQFNLLATERGVNQVAAALVPVGWKEEVRGGVRAGRSR